MHFMKSEQVKDPGKEGTFFKQNLAVQSCEQQQKIN